MKKNLYVGLIFLSQLCFAPEGFNQAKPLITMSYDGNTYYGGRAPNGSWIVACADNPVFGSHGFISFDSLLNPAWEGSFQYMLPYYDGTFFIAGYFVDPVPVVKGAYSCNFWHVFIVSFNAQGINRAFGDNGILRFPQTPQSADEYVVYFNLLSDHTLSLITLSGTRDENRRYIQANISTDGRINSLDRWPLGVIKRPDLLWKMDKSNFAIENLLNH